MAVAWMIFGSNGQFITSPNMPPTFRSTLQNWVQNNHWIINNIYFVPDSNGYVVLGDNVLFGSGYPQDQFDAACQLSAGGSTPLYWSWSSAGCWAVFCSDGAYQFGPNVPPAVTAALQAYMQSNQQHRTEYWASNLVFSPSGDWLLIGFDPADEGDGTYSYSTGFPPDVLAAVSSLPDRTGVATVSFDPDGGWVMFDTAGNLYWGSATPADVQTAAQEFASGNAITAIQFTEIGVYTMPVQTSFSLTGPIDPSTWTDQNVGVSQTYGLPQTQTISTPSNAQFGITTTTEGPSPAGQPVLTVISTAGFSVGQSITINPGGLTQETGTVESVTPGTSLTMESNLQSAHQNGEAVVATVPVFDPLANTYLLAIPASHVAFPFIFTFTDDSAKTPESPPTLGGNHAHWEIQIQQLALDAWGNLIPGPEGELPYWQVIGSTTVVDLFGPDSTNEAGSPGGAPVASPNQSVQQAVMIPVDFQNTQSALRVQYLCWLGDTNFEGADSYDTGPMEAAGTVVDGGGGGGPIVIAWSNDGAYATLAQWLVAVLPSDLVQLKALPVGLIYCPPGSKSSATLSYGTTNSLTWGFSDSSGNTYTVDDSISVSQQNMQSSTGSVSLNYAGYSLGLGASDQFQTQQTWDTSTTTGVTTTVQNAYTIDLTDAETWSWQINIPYPYPGETAFPNNQAFQEDTFLLIVHPQLAIWAYPSLNAVQLLASWPGLTSVAVSDLAAAALGTQGQTLTSESASVTLSAADCASLLSLDPFYAAQWQGATLPPDRFAYIQPCTFGTEITVTQNGQDYADKHQTMTYQSLTSSEQTYKESFSYTYTATVDSKYTYSTTEGSGFNFSVGFMQNLGSQSSGGKGDDKGGATGTGTQGSSGTSTSTTDVTQTTNVNYQMFQEVDYKTAVTYSGSLDDVNPVTQVKTSGAGTSILSVASTTYFYPTDVIIIDPNGSNMEVAVISSVQDGISFGLSVPLRNTHQSGEQVIPTWSYLQPNPYRDLLFGGIALQDTNAMKYLPIIHLPGRRSRRARKT
jgi:hypothetical protein